MYEYTETKAVLRLCKGVYSTWIDGKLVNTSFERGYFHEWGVESAEFETGGVTDSVALVELESGKVVTVAPRNLEFIKE